MTNDERMQRESSLITTIRTKLPEFAKACVDDAELVLLHQDVGGTPFRMPIGNDFAMSSSLAAMGKTKQPLRPK
jgi:hypothetical protein